MIFLIDIEKVPWLLNMLEHEVKYLRFEHHLYIEETNTHVLSVDGGMKLHRLYKKDETLLNILTPYHD